MMTNFEWGAVAYLTHSIYGKNSEVWINPNSDYKTGCAGTSVSAAETTACQAYNTVNGQQASTTGNITGIYDMSGGAWEYVAAYVDNGHANLNTYSSSLLSAGTKYKNVYKVGGIDSDINNYNENRNVYGDAVYETSDNSNGIKSWFDDYFNMVTDEVTVFNRGGRYPDGTNSGVFSFHRASGTSSVGGSHRVSLRIL